PYVVPISGPATYAAPPPPPPIYQTGGSVRGLSKNKKLLLIGLGCAAVLVALIAGGVVALAASQGHPNVAATATATATATPGTKVTLQPYSDPQGQFTLRYPSTWQVSTGAATVSGANSSLTTFVAMNAKGKATAGLVVAVGGSALTLQDAGTIAAQAGLTGFTPSGNAPMSISGRGGQTWQAITAIAAAPDGKQTSVAVAFAQHGASSYLVIGFNGGKAGNDAGRRLFATILRSFTFGSGG
ncbi:MAG TPA: hypothetical protein VKB76_08960, partial [Ktedonobacterales bacterium]|nr:hypothetical protein [Ktedonobacterales bacterium]